MAAERWNEQRARRIITQYGIDELFTDHFVDRATYGACNTFREVLAACQVEGWTGLFSSSSACYFRAHTVYRDFCRMTAAAYLELMVAGG